MIIDRRNRDWIRMENIVSRGSFIIPQYSLNAVKNSIAHNVQHQFKVKFISSFLAPSENSSIRPSESKLN